MKTFIFLIGTTDDFENLEALEGAYREDTIGWRNASVFTFEVPENLDRGHAFLIGCGLAFTNDWCMDGTFSTLLEG